MTTINISNLNISEVKVNDIHFESPISNIDTKLCPKCYNVKNVNDFFKNQSCCKTCSAENGKNSRQKYKEQNKNKVIEPNYQKTCCVCKQIKPATEYNRVYASHDGLNGRCKECDKLHKLQIKLKNKQNVLPDNFIKQCATCKNTLNKINFNNDFSTKDTLCFECKMCTKHRNLLLNQQYKIDNINKIFPADYHKFCSHCNQNKLYTEFQKHINSKSGLDSYCKQCKYEIFNNNIDQVLKARLLNSLYRTVNNIDKSEHTMNLLCCDIHFFKYWLEWQFQFDKNINWENYGLYWHLDHVKPCASFNLTNLKDQQLCCH